MRQFLSLFLCCIATSVAAADAPSAQFKDCRTLDACLAAMDADAHTRIHGASYERDAAYRAKLETFGGPAKRELLKRAASPDHAWSDLASSVLEKWVPVGPEDVPALIAALNRNPGGWIARPLGQIGTPEALAALAEDIRLHGTHNQSGPALAEHGEQAIPYLLPVLDAEDKRGSGEARWEDAAELIAEMKSAHDDLPNWVAIARDGKQPAERRIGALRVIMAMGSDAKDVAPQLRPLLDDQSVWEAAAATLRSMADESVAASRNDCQTSDTDEVYFDSGLCLSNRAAYGPAVRPMAPIIFQMFSSASDGSSRANAASFAGTVGYKEARARLIEMLHDPDWRAVYAATRALGWLGAKDALPALQKVARGYWLESVRSEASTVIAALNGATGKLAPPVVRPGHLRLLPSIADFEIDAMMAPDVAPCSSNRWIWNGTTFTQPAERVVVDRMPTVDLQLPDGKLVGVDAGEFTGDLNWIPSGGVLETVYRGNIDWLARAPGGVLAISNAGGGWKEYEDPGKPRQVGPNGEEVETVILSNGSGGSGYVFYVWRDASGGWRAKDIAVLPRSAYTFTTLDHDRYVAWSGNRAIVFSLKGVEGVAQCVASK
ncbi:MAG TPA: HEAT repeat domain-containing protein [Rhizomicrobium sp.]|nr:HEAT repeat domain-containing protein [Rhizomicrobium sp.]